MPQVSSFKEGQFCWIELATTDAKAAKSFYTNLFGWSVNEIPMGDQGTYYMFQKNGATAAAMAEQQPAERSSGVPPHWNNYIAVDNADAAAAKAKSLGANVVAGPFDVMDAGRMAFVIDPQGAAFALWQGGRTPGVGVVNEPGAFGWNELYSPQIDASRKFYSSMFDWKLKVSPEYTEAHLGEQAIAGMMQLTPEMSGMPPAWIPYFVVTDADASASKVKSAGGQVYVGPQDIPNVGRFAIVADPQGATFAIIKLG
jgi:uncharacterized protein